MKLGVWFLMFYFQNFTVTLSTSFCCNMEALQVFPVIIESIPRIVTVNFLYNQIFCTSNLPNCSKYVRNLIFHSPTIDTNFKWLLTFKNIECAYDLVHHINKSQDKYNCTASIPSEPYLEQKVNKCHIKKIGLMKNYCYKRDKAWKSYNFINCLAIQLSKIVGSKWSILPINKDSDRWHLIIFSPKYRLKDKKKGKNDVNFYKLKASQDFDGFIDGGLQNESVKMQKYYKKESIGLLHNESWNCDHIFELKQDFVSKNDLFYNKKAVFSVCVSHSVINSKRNLKRMQSIFDYLKPDQHFYALNVRIEMNDKQIDEMFDEKQCQPLKRKMTKKRRRQQMSHEYHISRLIDVRLWNFEEINEFLIVCVDGKYHEKFLAHNVKGKRLEYITKELLVYLGVSANDANQIIKCKNFFVDWLSTYNIFCLCLLSENDNLGYICFQSKSGSRI